MPFVQNNSSWMTEVLPASARVSTPSAIDRDPAEKVIANFELRQQHWSLQERISPALIWYEEKRWFYDSLSFSFIDQRKDDSASQRTFIPSKFFWVSNKLPCHEVPHPTLNFHAHDTGNLCRYSMGASNFHQIFFAEIWENNTVSNIFITGSRLSVSSCTVMYSCFCHTLPIGWIPNTNC